MPKELRKNIFARKYLLENGLSNYLRIYPIPTVAWSSCHPDSRLISVILILTSLPVYRQYKQASEGKYDMGEILQKFYLSAVNQQGRINVKGI
jgi:hypothetical protein